MCERFHWIAVKFNTAVKQNINRAENFSHFHSSGCEDQGWTLWTVSDLMTNTAITIFLDCFILEDLPRNTRETNAV